MQTSEKDVIVEKFKSLPTACVSDAMDKFGILGSAHGIAPLKDDLTLIGRAFTVRYTPVGSGGGTVGDFIDEVPLGYRLLLGHCYLKSINKFYTSQHGQNAYSLHSSYLADSFPHILCLYTNMSYFFPYIYYII